MRNLSFIIFIIFLISCSTAQKRFNNEVFDPNLPIIYGKISIFYNSDSKNPKKYKKYPIKDNKCLVKTSPKSITPKAFYINMFSNNEPSIVDEGLFVANLNSFKKGEFDLNSINCFGKVPNIKTVIKTKIKNLDLESNKSIYLGDIVILASKKIPNNDKFIEDLLYLATVLIEPKVYSDDYYYRTKYNNTKSIAKIEGKTVYLSNKYSKTTADVKKFIDENYPNSQYYLDNSKNLSLDIIKEFKTSK